MTLSALGIHEVGSIRLVVPYDEIHDDFASYGKQGLARGHMGWVNCKELVGEASNSV